MAEPESDRQNQESNKGENNSIWNKSREVAIEIREGVFLDGGKQIAFGITDGGVGIASAIKFISGDLIAGGLLAGLTAVMISFEAQQAYFDGHEHLNALRARLKNIQRDK